MKTVISKRENGSRRVMLELNPESKVEQSHKKSCNINTIIAKAFRTGMVKQTTQEPKYGDFSGVEDFHSAQDRIIEAEEQFLGLTSAIRNRFNNDPGELIEFLNNPQNHSEAVEMGLLHEPEPPVIKVGDVVPEPAKAPAQGGEGA